MTSPVATFVPPRFEDFADPKDYGSAYWKARFAFIEAGYSERSDEDCMAIDPEDGTHYLFRVQQSYCSLGSDLGSTSGHDLPHFASADEAIAYLEAAPFPGNVQRVVMRADGTPSWITAGVAYHKYAGEQAYWAARNRMPDVTHWHPDLGQTGPGAVPCPYCAPTTHQEETP